MIEISHVTKRFQGKKDFSLSQISLNITKGVSYGIIGESGGGKTTLGKLIIGFYRYLDEGSIKISNHNKCITKFNDKEMRKYRQMVQMVFQHPDTSLNPMMNIERQIREAMRINPEYNEGKKPTDYMDEIKLPANKLSLYPYELSGGEKRLISLAQTFAINPELLIADEPFSSLDASIRNHIANLIKKRQQETKLTLLLISHDIEIIKYLCQTVGVLWNGRLVEVIETKSLQEENVKHPYTSKFLKKEFIPEEKIDKEAGCPAWKWCNISNDKSRCQKEQPSLEEIMCARHKVACHSVKERIG